MDLPFDMTNQTVGDFVMNGSNWTDPTSNTSTIGLFPDSHFDMALENGPKRDPLYVVIPITFIYMLIFVTGVVGNISTCIVISKNKSMHTATNYYLFSLAISDFLLLVSGVPQEVYSIWSRYPYVFGELFCVVRGIMAETAANATVLTITSFTVERYLAICHPFLQHTMSKLSRAVKLIIGVWIVSISLAVPQALQFGVITDNNNIDHCAIKRVIVEHSFELSTLLFFLTPMTLITVLYILIGLKLRTSGLMKRENGVSMQRRVHVNSCHRQQASAGTRRVLKMLGRIHSAMVSKINHEARSVTVEWFERNETKGKEIELDTILQLNAEITQQEELAASMPKIIKQTSSNALTRDQASNSSDEQCDEDDEDDDEDSYYDEDGQLPAAMVMSTEKSTGHTALSNNGSGATLSIRNAKSDATQGNIRFNRTGIQHSMSYASNGNRTARATINQNGQGDHIENIPPQSQLPTKTSNRNTSRMSVVQPAPAPAPVAVIQTAASNPTGRRSYVVKEVERLKENREKRRAQQAEMKEQKNALMNMDPGNPNWELAAMIREYQSQVEFRPLVDGQAIEDHQITVCVRKRPVSRKEVMKKELDVISVPNKDQLIVHEPKTKVDLTKFLENHKFRFDYAFDESCSNELVYKYTAKPLVKTIFDGGMATCFAYGQTGSGKTHTMGGQFNGKTQDCKNGIYAMATKDVFSLLNGPKYRHLNLMISCSFFEIYSGKVFDLLGDKQKLRVLEDGKQQVQVVGLTEKVVDSVEEVLKLIQHGNVTRTSGQTSANANSSRSHAIFQIVLRPPGSTRIHGKFSFIDLAGNERGADTSSANRQTRMEGAEINKSLLALKECIRALGKQNAHLPFRVSKLTQVLRDSFIGEKSKTCMIAMISPGLNSCEHTLNTLRYANRVKELVVQDPELRNDGIEQMESDDNHKNGDSNETEYAHLRSLSEHDMSDDLLNQHAAISEIQQAEEIVVDQHKAINEFLAQFVPESLELYKMTNSVDYDQDAYSKRGEEIFAQLADLATTCQNLMADFRGKLANEEMLSHNVHPGKR